MTLTASLDYLIASGTVDFTDGSTVLCSDVPLQDADTETTLPGGIEEFQLYLAATCTTTFSTEGAHYLFATYGGDTYGDEPSQGELTLDVSNQAATTTTVTADSATPVVGQLANYTASVSDYPGGPTPGGTITFTSGTTTLCSGVALSPSGTAGCAYAFQAPGAETVTATYSGDANTFGSSGQVSVTVGQASSNTRVLVLTPASFPGQTVTYQAIVQAAAPDVAGPAPTGTVTFTNDGTTVCSGVALSTTAPFAATCAQAYAASGDETVTATYSGDSNTIGSSGQASVSIRKAPSNTSLSASTSAPVVGQPVAYTATVSTNAPDDPNPPAPTGTVTFTNGANTVCSDVTLSTTAPYTATCSQTYTGPGFENLTANYSGDDAALASQAQAGVSVTKASSSTSITASAAAPVVGQPVTYTRDRGSGAAGHQRAGADRDDHVPKRPHLALLRPGPYSHRQRYVHRDVLLAGAGDGNRQLLGRHGHSPLLSPGGAGRQPGVERHLVDRHRHRGGGPARHLHGVGGSGGARHQRAQPDRDHHVHQRDGHQFAPRYPFHRPGRPPAPRRTRQPGQRR